MIRIVLFVIKYSDDTMESRSSIEELLSSNVHSLDADYQHLEPVLALHAVMTTVLLRRASSVLEERSHELSSNDLLDYQGHVSALFKSVNETLTQQIQLAIKAKRFEVRWLHSFSAA